MSIGVLIIAHGDHGPAVLRQLKTNIGTPPLNMAALAVDPNGDPEQARIEAARLAAELDSGDGIVIVTDLYGATPSNIAHSLDFNGQKTVVHGLNLAMLMRACNYRDCDLTELTAKMVEGGRRAVFSGDEPA